jgi:Flp pilus assembly protein TadG
MRATRRSGRSDRGAVVVEFALVMPLLFLLVFGIIDFGWMIDRSNVINNVTRDAARVASLDGTYAEIETTLRDELADIGVTYPGPDVSVAITCTNASGSNCDGTSASYTANATSGSAVKVRVSYTHHWITPVGALCSFFGGGTCTGDTIALTRTSEMIRE